MVEVGDHETVVRVSALVIKPGAFFTGADGKGTSWVKVFEEGPAGVGVEATTVKCFPGATSETLKVDAIQADGAIFLEVGIGLPSSRGVTSLIGFEFNEAVVRDTADGVFAVGALINLFGTTEWADGKIGVPGVIAAEVGKNNLSVRPDGADVPGLIGVSEGRGDVDRDIGKNDIGASVSHKVGVNSARYCVEVFKASVLIQADDDPKCAVSVEGGNNGWCYAWLPATKVVFYTRVRVSELKDGASGERRNIAT